MGQSRPLFVYFRSFLITISIQIEKNIDGVLVIRTQGRTMVGADETTELWQPQCVQIMFHYQIEKEAGFGSSLSFWIVIKKYLKILCYYQCDQIGRFLAIWLNFSNLWLLFGTKLMGNFCNQNLLFSSETCLTISRQLIDIGRLFTQPFWLLFQRIGQCDQIGRFIGPWATLQSLWQQLICPNLLHS